ncbi:MAG: hypothetical protein SF028_09720 [Candidatus Sumerlaeia bacterium]|nr:hypothetical protein [Candidatus Sumerlaeia bacterium]
MNQAKHIVHAVSAALLLMAPQLGDCQEVAPYAAAKDTGAILSPEEFAETRLAEEQEEREQLGHDGPLTPGQERTKAIMEEWGAPLLPEDSRVIGIIAELDGTPGAESFEWFLKTGSMSLTYSKRKAMVPRLEAASERLPGSEPPVNAIVLYSWRFEIYDTTTPGNANAPGVVALKPDRSPSRTVRLERWTAYERPNLDSSEVSIPFPASKTWFTYSYDEATEEVRNISFLTLLGERGISFGNLLQPFEREIGNTFRIRLPNEFGAEVQSWDNPVVKFGVEEPERSALAWALHAAGSAQEEAGLLASALQAEPDAVWIACRLALLEHLGEQSGQPVLPEAVAALDRTEAAYAVAFRGALRALESRSHHDLAADLAAIAPDALVLNAWSAQVLARLQSKDSSVVLPVVGFFGD